MTYFSIFACLLTVSGFINTLRVAQLYTTYRVFLTALLLLSGYGALAQNNREVDSLTAELQKFEEKKAMMGSRFPAEMDTVKAVLLSDLSIATYRINPDAAMEYADRQWKVSKNIDYIWGMANALEMKGTVYEYKRDYDNALNYFMRSLQLYNGINNKLNALDVVNSIGILYAKKGVYTASLTYLLKALDMAKANNDMRGFISSYNNIGLIFTEQNKPDEALKYYLKCLKLQLKDNYGFGISYTYLNIGEIYRRKKQLDSALQYFTLGLESARRETDDVSVANNLSNIGSLYVDMGEYAKATEFHEKALAIRQKIEDGFGLFASYNAFSTIFHKTGNYNEALRYATLALSHIKDSGEKNMHAETYRQLSAINASMGNYKAAYDNQLLYKTYNDSIFNQENERKLTEQKMNFEFKNIQQEKDRAAKEALTAQKNIRNYTVAGLTAFAAFIIFLLLRRHRRSKAKKQREYDRGIDMLQEEITHKDLEAQAIKVEYENIQLKNDLITLEKEKEQKEKEKLLEKLDFNRRELASTTLYLFQKNQMLSELKTEIDSIKQVTASTPQFENILASIQQNLYLDADWDKFKQHFEQVHPDFFKELNEKHPGLTAYEVRLYAYLHMQLSTKEIAGLLNITPASVIKAKVRLNKKLNKNSNDKPDAEV